MKLDNNIPKTQIYHLKEMRKGGRRMKEERREERRREERRREEGRS